MKEQDLSFSFALNKIRRESLLVSSAKYLADGLDHLLVAFRLQDQRINDTFMYLGVPQTRYLQYIYFA